MYLGAINYTGNKEKLLPSLIPLFPSDYSRLVDVCCGGLSVSLSIDKPTLSNDIDSKLIELYQSMGEFTAAQISERISQFRLSKTDKSAYEEFRDQYNKNPNPLDLLILHYYSFSNMMRFNGNKFNAPFGRREINPRSLKKLANFKENIHRIEFSNLHYLKLTDLIKPDDFVYVDPPYLITTAEYNKFWSNDEEVALLKWLDELNDKGIKFGLSNVIKHRGKTNTILIEWMKKYNTHYLNKKYVFNIHHADGVDNETVEVFICNY